MSERIQYQLRRAGAVVKALVRGGHEVLRVTVGPDSKPTIEVAHTPACADLHGIETYEITDAGPKASLVSLVHDCRVQWRVN